MIKTRPGTSLNRIVTANEWFGLPCPSAATSIGIVRWCVHLLGTKSKVSDIVNDIETKLLKDVQAIREIVAQQGRLSVDVFGLDATSDLYSAGLTSLATVGIMLALEDRFDIEFPESMLSRKTFNSVASISEAVSQLAT